MMMIMLTINLSVFSAIPDGMHILLVLLLSRKTRTRT